MYDQVDDDKSNWTVARIAAEFGVTRPTIYRYLEQEAFVAPAAGKRRPRWLHVYECLSTGPTLHTALRASRPLSRHVDDCLSPAAAWWGPCTAYEGTARPAKDHKWVTTLPIRIT